jgi:CO dehydrogenase/acetyl-CoA synthase gamma subunit (corrinoid Fe-S protein)
LDSSGSEYDQKADYGKTVINIRVPRKQKNVLAGGEELLYRIRQDYMEETIIYVDGQADG